MEKKSIFKGYIVITGPESTGKTELAKLLAHRLQCEWIPEISRDYIESLNRKYTYDDVVKIASIQIQQFHKIISESKKIVIFDTGLIITKVWFDVVFNKCPDWLIEAIHKLPKALHLLCSNDLPWIPDSVRENGGEMRKILFNTYCNELLSFGFPYEIISGTGEQRFLNACAVLKGYEILES
jgi:nicotinamide riboside kinase